MITFYGISSHCAQSLNVHNELNGQISEQLKTKHGGLQGPQGRPGAGGKQGMKGEKVRPRCASSIQSVLHFLDLKICM